MHCPAFQRSLHFVDFAALVNSCAHAFAQATAKGHTHAHIYNHDYAPACARNCAPACAYVNACAHSCVYSFAHTCANVCVNAYVNTFAPAFAQSVSTPVPTRISTQVPARISTQVPTPVRPHVCQHLCPGVCQRFRPCSWPHQCECGGKKYEMPGYSSTEGLVTHVFAVIIPIRAQSLGPGIERVSFPLVSDDVVLLFLTEYGVSVGRLTANEKCAFSERPNSAARWGQTTAQKYAFLPCGNLDFESAVTAQYDRLKGSFHSSHSRLLNVKTWPRNSIFGIDTFRYVR